jgi:hypothetical protein
MKLWEVMLLMTDIASQLSLRMCICVTLTCCPLYGYNDTFSKKLNGCYIKLLCYAFNYKWSDYVMNGILYSGLEFVIILLLENLQCFARHFIRSKQSIRDLLLWTNTKLQISNLQMCKRCF